MNETLYLLLKLIGEGHSVITDSRQIKPGCIFLALKGESFDGNAFALQALENGAQVAVIDNPKYVKNSQTLLVPDVLETLQKLANEWRKKFKIPVIGITGTNGKTTTKELVREVVAMKYKTHATSGNFNNHIGVPLTLLSMPADSQVAIIEMGANHLNEIAELCEIALPNLGIITNVGKAHLEGFGSFEGIVETKTGLYRSIKNRGGVVFVNSDNNLLILKSGLQRRVTYGQRINADFRGKILDSSSFLRLSYISENREWVIQTKLVGNYNFDNVMAAITVGKYLNVPDELIKEAIEHYQPSNNRSQWIESANNQIIMDAYNANPSSMNVALENFRNLSANNKVVILGDMLELGEYSDEEHQKVIEMIETMNLSQVILIGPVFKSVCKSSSIQLFYDSDEAKVWLLNHKITESLVLLKGSRGIKLEKVLETL
jgi:UDP-N-acetylmuramoyl-tripeptide--D-alanyl-D-alanine ligase